MEHSYASSSRGGASRASPLAATPARKARIFGSPVNFRKPPGEFVGSDVRPSAAPHTLSSLGFQHSVIGSDAADNPNVVGASPKSSRASRRPRPATSQSTTSASGVTPLAAKTTLHAMLASYERSVESLEHSNQPRPESAPEPHVRRHLAVVTPLLTTSSALGTLESPNPSVSKPVSASSPLSVLHSPGSMPRQTQRCAGCGAFAELCMGCFAHFRLQDSAAYKKQIARSVEVLFEKATARAFTKISAVIQQWLFGVWKSATQVRRRQRTVATRVLQKQRLHRWFATWHECIYKRRIVGAMLYAEDQQQTTRVKSREVAELHGEVFAISSNASVQDQLHTDALAQLQQFCATQEVALLAKNQELLTLRRELQDAKNRLAVLETQAIDPRELERIKSESVDFKKVAFQLAAALCQSLETQVELLATSEGRHNLSQTFSKDVLQTLDKPECQAFYNPLVELESASASASASSSSGAPDAAAASFFASFDAPTDRAEKILMQWVNALVQKQHGLEWLAAPRMANFHSSLADGKLLAVLTKVLHQAMCRVRPKRPPGAVSSKLEATSVLRENGEDLTEIAMERYLEHMRKEESTEKRLELMIGTIGQALWLPTGLLTAKDILAGDAEFNFAALAYLFATFSPCLDEPFYALCTDLKLQLSSTKAKWRELREAPPVASTASAVAVTSSSYRGGNSSTQDVLRRSRGLSRDKEKDKEKDESGGDSDDSALSSKMKLALAHTMEIKRRVDVEDQKAREGHALWWKSTRIVLRKCFLSYARLARGQAGVLTRLDAAGDENEAFAKVPKPKLQDLELPFEDFAWEMKLLQSFLLTVHCDLARIYRGYATRNGVVNEFISVGDFLELLAECRVLDAHVTATDVAGVLKKVDPKQTSTSVHRALPPLDFLEALIRVARMKYSAECVRLHLSALLAPRVKMYSSRERRPAND